MAGRYELYRLVRRGWAALHIGDRGMAEFERDDSKKRHSFCQIGIAHGAWPKLGLGSGTQLQLWLQVSIWDIWAKAKG